MKLFRERVKKGDAKPPSWARNFLAWYCRPRLLEDLEGDLYEHFGRHVKSVGIQRARFIYILNVLGFIRPYTLRKPKFLSLFIHWIMIGSYIKTSGRSIVRNKLFSTLNIVGLAISMSVGLLMISFLSDLFSYDTFHEKGDCIYRVIDAYQYLEEPPNEFASTSVKTGKLIREKVAGVEDLVILRAGFRGDAQVGDNVLPLRNALWADESFFNVFSFPLVSGDAATALKEPYSVVLTESSAMKLFGGTDALDKPVKFDTTEYVVTGVMKDAPRFSHLRFDALVSFVTKEIQEKENKRFLSWNSIWENYVYLLLPENRDLQALQASLDKISTDENAGIQNVKIKLELQPLNEIAVGKDLSNSIGPFMMDKAIWIVGGLALVVLLSACFNYTNLSIARSFRRSREVGIRKVIGAQKGHVVGQFISEAVIISLLALIFSFLLFLFLRPQFLSIAPELGELVVLDLSPRVIAFFIMLAIAVGIVAGFLPALFFSRINAIQVLKDLSSLKVFRNVAIRKVLIVVQYTVSLIFITSAVIEYKQYKNFLNFDLGFSTENILNIRAQGNQADLLIKELKELPEVSALSKSLMVTSVGTYYGEKMKYNNPQDSANIWYNSIDENYLPLHGHIMLAGRNFTYRPPNGTESEVIVNEKVLKRFDIGKKDPSKALGEVVTIGGRKLTIVGVLKDFHYGKVNNEIDPIVFRYLVNEPAHFVNAMIASSDILATMEKIGKAWRKIDRIHPLEATFYDEQIKRTYSEFSAMIKIIGFLAFLAVCISSLGLLGMVVFTTETRLKEMSIRKVLGANEGDLIYLLSRGFLVLLTVSTIVALPLTYLFFDKVVLASIAYRAPMGLADLLSGVAAVMTIAFLMIGSQTLRVARSNPADVLKNE